MFESNEAFKDVEIHASGTKFTAHKIVLAAWSPVFESVLQSFTKVITIDYTPNSAFIKWFIIKNESLVSHLKVYPCLVIEVPL
jgi:hypothetical protein